MGRFLGWLRKRSRDVRIGSGSDELIRNQVEVLKRLVDDLLDL